MTDICNNAKELSRFLWLAQRSENGHINVQILMFDFWIIVNLYDCFISWDDVNPTSGNQILGFMHSSLKICKIQVILNYSERRRNMLLSKDEPFDSLARILQFTKCLRGGIWMIYSARTNANFSPGSTSLIHVNGRALHQCYQEVPKMGS